MVNTIIAVTNQKGGVGKTTTAVNIAYNIAKSGHTVLLVDFDPQGNATSGLGVDKRELQRTIIDVVEGQRKLGDCVISTRHKNLHLLPSAAELANTEVELAKAQHKFTRLKQALEGHSYEYVIIDCPPSLSLLTVNALIAA